MDTNSIAKPKSPTTTQRSGAHSQNQNPPRRHGDTEKIKTNFHQRGHRGHGGELETKSSEGAEENQIKAIKFAQTTKKFAISNTETRKRSKSFSPLILRLAHQDRFCADEH